MVATRSSPPADRARDAGPVVRAVERALAAHVPAGALVAVALSGGRDSVALLAAVREARPGGNVVAIHVNHGWSAHADAWAASCARLSASVDVALIIRRVDVVRDGTGLEAAARAARYGALASAARGAGASAVLLGHHQDDQAETLLLQLLRGSGVHGLSGMPHARHDADGLVWLRPFLDLPRAIIDGYVAARGLRYVDDDSNASAAHRRNALRQRVVPAIAGISAGYPATLARAALHQAEAARLLDDLAALDAERLIGHGTLDCVGLAALAPHRARNLLRHFLRSQGLRAPSTPRLAAFVAQVTTARADARIRFRHDGATFGLFRGRLARYREAPSAYEQAWRGETILELPHGRLAFAAEHGKGLAAAWLERVPIVVRPRAGGERLQLSAARPRRALKAWLQEASLPAWERESLPLVFCGGALAAVPGLGVDVAFQAAPDAPGFTLAWKPAR